MGVSGTLRTLPRASAALGWIIMLVKPSASDAKGSPDPVVVSDCHVSISSAQAR